MRPCTYWLPRTNASCAASPARAGRPKDSSRTKAGVCCIDPGLRAPPGAICVRVCVCVCVCVCVYVAFVFEAQNVVQEAKQCARQGRLLRKRFASAVQAPRKVFATGSISNIAPFASRSMSFKSCVHRLGGGGAQSRPKSRPNSTEALPKCCASAVQALCKLCASGSSLHASHVITHVSCVAFSTFCVFKSPGKYPLV